MRRHHHAQVLCSTSPLTRTPTYAQKSRGSVGSPAPGNGGLRTPHSPRNATAHRAAQTTMVTGEVTASSWNVWILEGVRHMGLYRLSSCSSVRMWKTPSRRTQQIRCCGVACSGQWQRSTVLRSATSALDSLIGRLRTSNASLLVRVSSLLEEFDEKVVNCTFHYS